MYFVISVFPISMTSGRVATGEGRVELREVSTPRLVLDVDIPAGVLGLELSVGRSHDLRPAGLRVDLEPDGQCVGGELPPDAPEAPTATTAERGDERGGGENTYVSFASPAAILVLERDRVG